MKINLDSLSSGDHILYSPTTLFGRLICLKTWSPVSHIEIYKGDGVSMAARDGLGVNSYATRLTDVYAVLRPREAERLEDAIRWFEHTAKGQKYDWKGILCFTLAVKQGSKNKMFCSEFATRFDRWARIKSFHHEWDADKIAPVNFLMSPAFRHVML